MKKLIAFLVLVLLVAVFYVYYYEEVAAPSPIETTSIPKQEEAVLGNANIRVFSPKNGEEVSLPLLVSGEARVFENQFNFRLRDEDGTILAMDSVYAHSPDTGQFGPFNIEKTYPTPKGNAGTIEIFDYSAKDGTEQDKVVISVRFKKIETMKVKIFFGNNTYPTDGVDCNIVYSTERWIPKTEGVLKAAIEELLKGETAFEKEKGFYTSLNPGVKLQKVELKNGVAKLDFDKTMQKNMGGSCRVSAIRAQIEQTAKQFPEVKSVIISVNGNVAEALQP
jgi:hypothetical protein